MRFRGGSPAAGVCDPVAYKVHPFGVGAAVGRAGPRQLSLQEVFGAVARERLADGEIAAIWARYDEVRKDSVPSRHDLVSSNHDTTVTDIWARDDEDASGTLERAEVCLCVRPRTHTLDDCGEMDVMTSPSGSIFLHLSSVLV